MTNVDDTKEFDRVLRLLRAAQRRGGVSAAMTENNHRRTLESMLDRVDEARRERYRKAVES